MSAARMVALPVLLLLQLGGTAESQSVRGLSTPPPAPP
eukprot:SAG31_NODE_44552_length_262_cov_0.797546_1_plen_37_part_10